MEMRRGTTLEIAQFPCSAPGLWQWGQRVGEPERASPVQLVSVPKTEQLHRGGGGTPTDHPGDNERKSIWRQRNEPRRTTFPEQPNGTFFHLGRALKVLQGTGRAPAIPA